MQTEQRKLPKHPKQVNGIEQIMKDNKLLGNVKRQWKRTLDVALIVIEANMIE